MSTTHDPTNARKMITLDSAEIRLDADFDDAPVLFIAWGGGEPVGVYGEAHPTVLRAGVVVPYSGPDRMTQTIPYDLDNEDAGGTRADDAIFCPQAAILQHWLQHAPTLKGMTKAGLLDLPTVADAVAACRANKV